MKLRELMLKDTPCQAGLAFIEAHPGMVDLDLAECWDLIKAEAPLFLGWGVKHAPMSKEKIRAIKLLKASGVMLRDGSIDEARNHDPAVAKMCFGWIANPFRGVS